MKMTKSYCKLKKVSNEVTSKQNFITRTTCGPPSIRSNEFNHRLTIRHLAAVIVY